MSVLFTTGFARVSEEILNRFVSGVEKLDEDEDAIVGDVGGLTQLFDFALRQGVGVALGMKGQSKGEENEGERDPAEHWFLVFEDFGEELFVDLVELFQSDFEGVLIFARSFAEIFRETIGGVVHEHLGVLETLAVAGHIHVDELRVLVDLPEGCAGLVDVAVEHLPAGHLGHGVDELCVEEALVARTGLLGAEFELGQGLCIRNIFIVAGGVDRSTEGKQQEQR
jgi:hypothetical protein